MVPIGDLNVNKAIFKLWLMFSEPSLKLFYHFDTLLMSNTVSLLESGLTFISAVNPDSRRDMLLPKVR